MYIVDIAPDECSVLTFCCNKLISMMKSGSTLTRLTLFDLQDVAQLGRCILLSKRKHPCQVNTIWLERWLSDLQGCVQLMLLNLQVSWPTPAGLLDSTCKDIHCRLIAGMKRNYISDTYQIMHSGMCRWVSWGINENMVSTCTYNACLQCVDEEMWTPRQGWQLGAWYSVDKKAHMGNGSYYLQEWSGLVFESLYTTPIHTSDTIIQICSICWMVVSRKK